VRAFFAKRQESNNHATAFVPCVFSQLQNVAIYVICTGT